MMSVSPFAWFCPGTGILTPTGEVPVEALAPGNPLVTIRKDGPPTVQIARIAHRLLDFSRHPAPENALPVRVRAGAFAPGMPARDLRLAPNHAIYADGVFIAVLALCDGIQVFQEAVAAPMIYTRVELASHDVILAEGLPVASSRGGPDNVTALHLYFGEAPALCLPLLHEGREVEAMRRVLAYRSGVTKERKNFFL